MAFPDDDPLPDEPPRSLKVPPRPQAYGGLPGFEIPGVNSPTETSALLQALRPLMGGAAPQQPPQQQAPQPRLVAPGMPPQMAQSPMAQLTRHVLPQPPTPKYRDPLEAMANPLTVMALLGSLFTRQPATTAMKSLAGAMKASAEGDQVRYANEYQKYTQELNKAHTETQEELAEYKMIYENRRLSLAERTARMRGVATRRGDSVMNSYLDSGGDPGTILDARGKAVAPITEAKAKAQRIAQIRTESGKAGGRALNYVEAEAQYNKEKQDAKSAAADGTGQSDDRSLTGQAYLDTLPPTRADYIQGIAEGRIMPPSTRSVEGQRTMSQVARYKHDFRGQTYGGQAAAERNFSAGELRRNIRSANTLIGHVGRLDSNIDYLGTTNFRTANKAIIEWARETGDPRILPVLTDIHFVAEEMSRALKGTATEGDIHRGLALLDSAMSVPQVRAAARELVHLLESRTKEMEREAATTTGRSPEETKALVLSPESKETVKRLEQGGGPEGSTPGGFTPDGRQLYKMPDGSLVVAQ